MAYLDKVTINNTTYNIQDTSTQTGVSNVFSATTAYSAGQYVWYDGDGTGAKLYRFTAAHAAGAWVGTDATQVALSNDVAELKSALDSKVHYLSSDLTERIYPVWESGRIDKDTGADVISSSTVRTDYISKDDIALWNVDTHTGALYVYRYSYADGAYTYLGRNQRVNAGDFTDWLKSLDGTHLRFTAEHSYPNKWMTLCYSTQIGKDIESLKETQTKTNTNESNIGYWRHTYAVAAGESHSATLGEVPVSIPSGHKFAIKEATNVDMNRQFYVYYSDGTNERLYNYSATGNIVERNIVISAKAKDITSISVYINNTTDINVEMTFEVFVDDSLCAYTGYPHVTQYYIENDDDTRTYFEMGRARSLVQTIAVYNNQVWEFAQGKATYNGVEYDLANGHGNNCNWGVTLHGDYPYLYCPTWTLDEMNINVFSFDGTAFTLVNTIHYNGYTGYLNAYVDEQAGFIYAFVFADNSAGACHYLVSDLTGTVLMEKDLPYLIRTIQGLCMHHGVIYAVSGYGNTASPNYLHKISPDGALLGKYVMGAIGSLGEIEGIDFLDNQMVLATYYRFYVNPQKSPNALRVGYTKQLELNE